jgi:hypothetical protein
MNGPRVSCCCFWHCPPYLEKVPVDGLHGFQLPRQNLMHVRGNITRNVTGCSANLAHKIVVAIIEYSVNSTLE